MEHANSPILRPWGKLNREDGGTVALSLVDHCIDVAAVFRALVELPSVRRCLERAALHALSSAQLDRLAVLAFWHDIGKCNCGFQRKGDCISRDTAGHTREVGALFFCSDLSSKLVQSLGLRELRHWAASDDGVTQFLIASISHHGRPAINYNQNIDAVNYRRFWSPDGNYDPFEAFRNLGSRAREMFPTAFGSLGSPLNATPRLQQVFAGLVMLADWLGSHPAFYPYEHEGADRIPWASKQAHRAVAAVGLDVSFARASMAKSDLRFEAIFGRSPRSAQSKLDDASLAPLLLLEAETGSGKTEAALAHFFSVFKAGYVDSLYYALPTRVAACEIYDRVRSSVARVFGPAHPPVLLAVPGYVRVDGEPVTHLPYDCRRHHDDPRRQERFWSAERPKRFLAAPIAVGTTDQALLSAIAVPHAHLRAACLNRGLLVLDEVHASDVYMRYLLRHLLTRHVALGGRALLLSATLAAAARVEFLTACDQRAKIPSLSRALAAGYPSLAAPGKRLQVLPNPNARSKRVRLEPLRLFDQPVRFRTLFPRLLRATAAGKRVLVITNTVGRAILLQKLVEADLQLVNFLFCCPVEAGVPVICPHHGRYARVDREIMDAAISARLGPRSRPGPLIIIGTQTLEQSLDIDADWLITDLCPMDVLLQRIGRLHRHDRGPRPEATCTILVPKTASLESWIRKGGQVNSRGGLGLVYADLRIVQLTLTLIGCGRTIVIPCDNRELVERATHPEALATLNSPAWREHTASLFGTATAAEIAAHSSLLLELPFGELRFPNIAARLATRLGLRDRTLPLRGIHRSPFGRVLNEITIPGHLCPDTESTNIDNIEATRGGIQFHYGDQLYSYSRFGLERLARSRI